MTKKTKQQQIEIIAKFLKQWYETTENDMGVHSLGLSWEEWKDDAEKLYRRLRRSYGKKD